MTNPVIAVIGRTVNEAEQYAQRTVKAPYIALAEHQDHKLWDHDVENFLCVPTVGDLPPKMIRVLAERIHDTDQRRNYTN